MGPATDDYICETGAHMVGRQSWALLTNANANANADFWLLAQITGFGVISPPKGFDWHYRLVS